MIPYSDLQSAPWTAGSGPGGDWGAAANSSTSTTGPPAATKKAAPAPAGTVPTPDGSDPTKAAHMALMQIGSEILLVAGLTLMADFSETGWRISAAVVLGLWLVFLVTRYSKG